MGSYLVEYDRPNCIGAGACVAASPKFWKMNYEKDSKANLIGAEPRDDEWEVLELSVEDFEEMKASAEICPVNAIHMRNKKTGEKII